MKQSEKAKSIYLIGIGGTGMGAFAGLLKEQGFLVSGSDKALYPPMSDLLKNLKIPVSTPYAKGNVPKDTDLVIVGNVVSKDNEEAKFVRENKIKAMSFPEALFSLFLKSSRSVVVSGTHGKTTTSALMAHVLKQADLGPGFLIGGVLRNYEKSFQAPKENNNFFVVEGDEYDTAYFDKRPKFLHYQPQYLLCTSLEFDHADIYQNVDQIIDQFAKLVSLVPKEGCIVTHNNEQSLKEAIKKGHPKAKLLTYGDKGHFEAADIRESRQGLSFEVSFEKNVLGKLQVALSGKHGVDNALGAYALLLNMGLKHREIAKGFESFKGVKRRMEEVGEVSGVIVVDDFAHHPTAVRTTISGAKRRYSDKEIWALYEPRSQTSCRKIFEKDYEESFCDADRVWIAPPGRQLPENEMLDIESLAAQLTKKGVKAKASSSIDAIISEIIKAKPKNVVLLCMSNGSFAGIHKRLLKLLT